MAEDWDEEIANGSVGVATLSISSTWENGSVESTRAPELTTRINRGFGRGRRDVKRMDYNRYGIRRNLLLEVFACCRSSAREEFCHTRFCMFM